MMSSGYIRAVFLLLMFVNLTSGCSTGIARPELTGVTSIKVTRYLGATTESDFSQMKIVKPAEIQSLILELNRTRQAGWIDFGDKTPACDLIVDIEKLDGESITFSVSKLGIIELEQGSWHFGYVKYQDISQLPTWQKLYFEIPQRKGCK